MEGIKTTTRKEFSRTERRKADDEKVLRRKEGNKKKRERGIHRNI